jgi:hypothetical protein
MNQPRDPDAIIATWLDDGPIDLPDETRRAISVGLRTQPRARRMAILGGSSMSPINRLVAAAAVVLAVGGLSAFVLSNRAGGPGATPAPPGSVAPLATPSPSPSVEPSPSVAPGSSFAAIGELTGSFSSPWYGYSIRYPANWSVIPAATFFDPVAWSLGDGPSEWLDVIAPPAGDGFLRVASALVPKGVDAEGWIAQYYASCDAVCMQARENVVIGGQPARLQADDVQFEATAIVGQRAYVFTLFSGGDASIDRALFDALVATVVLHPEKARTAPSPSPA